MYYFELETSTRATREETLLLYALGEELISTKKWVNRFSRISTDIIKIEVEAEDEMKALCRVYNALRCSKNYIAHTCAVTRVPV